MIRAEGCRVTITYAIVDQASLAARPLAGRLLPSNTRQDGGVTWRRTEAPHQIGLTSTWPVTELELLVPHFARSVARINEALAKEEACLLPGGLHPFMDPSCVDGQSSSVEMPAGPSPEATANAAELLLPLLPALTAASPFADGMHIAACTRGTRVGLEPVQDAGGRVSMIAGDTQEHPGRDVAICSVLARVVPAVARHDFDLAPLAERRAVHTATCTSAERALVPAGYVERLGVGNEPLPAGVVWRRLLERTETLDRSVEELIGQGPLATRVRGSLPTRPPHSGLVERYRRLADTLANGRTFED